MSDSGALVPDEGRVHHAAALAPKHHFAAVEIPKAAQIKGEHGAAGYATRLAPGLGLARRRGHQDSDSELGTPKLIHSGGGGGNRTRVRMASNGRVYVCSPCLISGVSAARTEQALPSYIWVSLPDTI